MSQDLGRVNLLGADAVGQPGQRRFRLFVRTSRGSAIIWMEKEQLNSLSLAIDRFLAQFSQGQVLRVEARSGGLGSTREMPTDFPRVPDYEFQIGQMLLNYEDQEELFLLRATPLESMLERDEAVAQDEANISFLFTLQEARELSQMIVSVVTAGRPVCPLCGTPLDGGPHACVKQNGHHQIIQIEVEEDNEE